MRGLNGAITEVFFHSEHVDPSFWEGETDCHVFARNLAVLATNVTGYQNIRSQFDFVAGDAESGTHLEWKLTVLWRTNAETQQLDVARIRGPESDK